MRAAIALGSNLGSRWAYLRAAVDALGRAAGVRVVARSSVFESAPVGQAQPDYLNAAVLVETSLDLRTLHGACKEVEAALGREPGPRWGPRVVDLDLALADETISDPDLRVPHPEARSRAFVLAPLLEVWPDARIGPASAAELLAAAGGVPPRRSAFAPEGDVEVLDHTADVALRVRAPDEPDLLAAAATGVADVILDRSAVRGRDRIDFEAEGADAEDRLVAVLSEVVARFDTDELAPRRVLVRAVEGPHVRASIWGERFDPERHAARTAVKAVTYHALRVEPSNGGLACIVTLDL